MNREQKQALAMVLIDKAGDLIEFWSEQIECQPSHEILKTIDGREAAQQIANWLGRLPGNGWDNRIPTPSYYVRD